MRIYSTSESPEADPAEHDDGNYLDSSLADAPVDVRRYGPRTWGVYFGGQLLCVTVYLRGAMAIRQLVEQFQDELRRAMSKGSSLPLASDPQAEYGQDQGKAP